MKVGISFDVRSIKDIVSRQTGGIVEDVYGPASAQVEGCEGSDLEETEVDLVGLSVGQGMVLRSLL